MYQNSYVWSCKTALKVICYIFYMKDVNFILVIVPDYKYFEYPCKYTTKDTHLNFNRLHSILNLSNICQFLYNQRVYARVRMRQTDSVSERRIEVISTFHLC